MSLFTSSLVGPLLLLVACGSATSSGTAEEGTAATSWHSPASTADRSPHYLISSTEYYPAVEPGLGAAVGDLGVYFLTRELDPYTNEWREERTFQATSFEVTGLAGISGTHFVVAGPSAGGNDVIELWTVQPARGAYVATRPLSPTSPIGESVATPPLTIGIVGDDYIPPAARSAPLLSRRVIFTGPDMGGIRAMSADPDGRFVMALGGSYPGLYRVGLDGTAALVLDPLEMPFLEDARTIQAVRDDTLGRYYLIRSFGISNGLLAIAAIDEDNDGIVDYTVLLDETEFETSTLTDPPTEDFLNYRD